MEVVVKIGHIITFCRIDKSCKHCSCKSIVQMKRTLECDKSITTPKDNQLGRHLFYKLRERARKRGTSVDPEEDVGCVDVPALPRRAVIRIKKIQDITKGETWHSANRYILIYNKVIDNHITRKGIPITKKATELTYR